MCCFTEITFKDLPPPYRENEEEAVYRGNHEPQIAVRFNELRYI